MLGDAIKKRVHTLATSMTPEGGRPPFTRRMTVAEALRWWLQHRYDQLGMPLVQQMQPQDVAALDAWLAQAMNTQPQPQAQAQKLAVPPGAPILREAQSQERRSEGAPAGDQVL